MEYYGSITVCCEVRLLKNIFKNFTNPYKDFNAPSNIKTAYIYKPLYHFTDLVQICDEDGQPLFNTKGCLTFYRQKIHFYDSKNKKIQTIREKNIFGTILLEGQINGTIYRVKGGRLEASFSNWHVEKHRNTYYILSGNNIMAELKRFKGNKPYRDKELRFNMNYSADENTLLIMLFALAIILRLTPSKSEQIEQIKAEKGWIPIGG